jgi:hypothetical protein
MRNSLGDAASSRVEQAEKTRLEAASPMKRTTPAFIARSCALLSTRRGESGFLPFRRDGGRGLRGLSLSLFNDWKKFSPVFQRLEKIFRPPSARNAQGKRKRKTQRTQRV